MDEAGSEGCEYQVVALLQTVLVLPDSQGDGGSRRVAEVLNVDHHLIHGQVQSLGHGLYDAHVSLMGHHPLDVVLRQAVTLGNECAVVAHVGHGIAEHGASLLIEVVQTVVDGEVAWGADRATCLQVQEGQSLAVAAEVGIPDAGILFLRSL